MLLSRIRLHHFRGVGHMDLRLGPTVVVLGDPLSGESALLDALSIALGYNAPTTAFPFRSGDLSASPRTRIRLDFREDPEQADWRCDPRLEPALYRRKDGSRAIAFEVVAKAAKDGEPPEVRWSFDGADGRALPCSGDPAVLTALRESFPILLVRGGLAYGNESLRRPAGIEPRDHERILTEATRVRVRDLYERVLESRTIPHDAKAVLETVRRSLVEYAEGGAPDWLENPFPSSLDPGAPASAQFVGLLLLAGSLVEAKARSHLDGEARPILALEHPGAHLHPAVLASIWELIGLLDAQKIVTTNSEAFLVDVPLHTIRRLIRLEDQVRATRLRSHTLDSQEQRRIMYHVRGRRGVALFARCWILVEGETEFWLLPELARMCGHDLGVEGVCCIEFAQCGVDALAKLANDLGIQWHLLADGDEAGEVYARKARQHMGGAREEDRLTVLPADNVEHYLWDAGFSDVYLEAARHGDNVRPSVRRTIQTATLKSSKPALALEVARRSEERGVPPVLASLIEKSCELAQMRPPAEAD